MTYGIDRERVTFMAKRSSRILGSVIGAAASVGALASRVAAVDPSAVRPMAAAHAQAQGSQTGAPAVSPERGARRGHRRCRRSGRW